MHPGQRIGKYVLGERIAVGGMAEVWAARAEGPEGFVKPVALKFILESFSGDPELEGLFFKEARIAAQLQHANLVAVFDFDKVPADPEQGHGRYYIAMEHVEGHDARRVVEAARHAGHVFPTPLALYLAGEVCKGLRYVHERREDGRPLGLVHRDVSPHNVLVGFSGEVKLSDFGIAKSLAHSSRTRTGTIRGKLSYASPEQLNGEPVDHRSDQFALGITLWEILAGRPLFDGHDEIEIVGKVMRCDVPSLALVCPDRKFPAELEATVRRMLSPGRAGRFPSTADALSALLASPGYSADGVGLGELVRTLFHRAGAGPSPTRAAPEARGWPPRPGGPRSRRGRDPALPRPDPLPVRGRGHLFDPGDARAGDPRPRAVETKTLDRPPGAFPSFASLASLASWASFASRPFSRRPGVRGRRGGPTTDEIVRSVRRGPERWWLPVVIAAALGGIAVGVAMLTRGAQDVRKTGLTTASTTASRPGSPSSEPIPLSAERHAASSSLAAAASAPGVPVPAPADVAGPIHAAASGAAVPPPPGSSSARAGVGASGLAPAPAPPGLPVAPVPIPTAPVAPPPREMRPPGASDEIAVPAPASAPAGAPANGAPIVE